MFGANLVGLHFSPRRRQSTAAGTVILTKSREHPGNAAPVSTVLRTLSRRLFGRQLYHYPPMPMESKLIRMTRLADGHEPWQPSCFPYRMPSSIIRSDVVLVVDDEQATGAIIKAILAAEGYEVHIASDGLQAWHLVQQFPGRYALVITDVTMADLDDLDLSARLKMTHPELPVLLISAFVSRSTQDQMRSRVAHLQKPFTSQALLREVRDADVRRRSLARMDRGFGVNLQAQSNSAA